MEIRCPQCDALIEVGTEHIITKCPYCGVPIFYKKDGLLTKESIKPTHDSSVAVNILKNLTGKTLSVKMEYFPFYRIESEDRTSFIPGKSISVYGIGGYIPQGDRIPLEMDVEEPEFSVDVALKRVGVEEAKAVNIVYLPFFTARDGDTFYCVDAAKGNILSNKVLNHRIPQRNQHPLSLVVFLVVIMSSIFIPGLIFKILSVGFITGFFWFYKWKKENA